jgi:outer membrane protein assembly factor BamB
MCNIAILAQPSLVDSTLLMNQFVFESKLSTDSSQVRIPPADFAFSDSSYTRLWGITTFRGGPFRDHASLGALENKPSSFTVKWKYTTKADKEWGGGAGWTGQPCIVKWPDSIRVLMNLEPAFKSDSSFVEVIQASLDGRIYFFDFATGKPSRPPINIHHPIKGSPSIDPRGLPLLYCGQGISNNNQEFGFRIFSLIDQKRLFFLNGRDPFAFRSWSAFDGSPLINAKNDQLILGGENGILYTISLNTKWRNGSSILSIDPQVIRYRYKNKSGNLQGIENSVAAFGNKIFFADNNGFIQSVDLNTQSTDWIHSNHDDTDATLVLDNSDTIPALYTGCEVDIQLKNGKSVVKKLNALNGEIIWERGFPCYTIRGKHPVNGGMLSTPILGKNRSSNVLVCSLSRYKSMNNGLLIAFNKKTGETIWENLLDNYAWSSPLDIYDKEGNMYIFLGDSKGIAMIFDGTTGQLLFKEKLAELFEASPVAIDNKIIIASRPNQIFCLEIN